MNLYKDENIKYLQRKIPVIIFAVVGLVLTVAVRLYYLQIAEGAHYNKMATEVFVREEEIVAPRGNITDRHGKVIADSRGYFEIVVTPQYLSNRKKVISNLTKILPLDEEAILAKLHEARFEPKFSPVVIARDIPYDWVARLEEYLAPVYEEGTDHDFSGVSVRNIRIRKYLYPEVFAHALGYLREIDKASLKKAREDQAGVFSLGDLTGAAGVEQAYDIPLKGVDGVFGRVVDARGREVTETEDLKILQQRATFPPKSGYTLRTTLDFDSQMVAHNAFKDKMGAAVAIDPRNGELIVLYSSPGYDANRITKIIDKEYWRKINLDKEKYLFNRAIQATYPPASTYKIVGLSGGIDSGLIDPEKTAFNCGGGMQFGNRFFKCWKSGGHGRLTALIGLAQSCDVFFYNVGLKLGVDRLAEYAHMFGFGSKTGLDIPFEKPGLIPTSAWKEKVYKQRWYESETLSIAIGQSYDLVTPLQNAVAVSVVANDGYLVTPHLGLEILSSQGDEVIKKIEYTNRETKLAHSKGLEWVRKGMIEVVHGMGTAKKLKLSPNKIAGKTGTAQVVSHGANVKKGTKTEAHALFISFAPYDDPQIAVAVVVEHGRGGSVAAAPIAGQIIDTYFGDKYKPAVDSSSAEKVPSHL